MVATLAKTIAEEKKVVNMWLAEKNNEVVNVEKSKRRFMKMEKWNNVI